jgi:hypothetical protein
MAEHYENLLKAKLHLADLKRKHHTTNALDALIIEGEDYSFYPDERATPVFIARLDEGMSSGSPYFFYFTIDVKKDGQLAVVARSEPTSHWSKSFCGC